MKVAFVGLGIMGSRMAAKVLAAGYELTVYNRMENKAQSLLSAGASWAASAAEAVREAEVVLTMLAHPEAVTDMALGEQGFLAGMHAGSLWIDSSTVNPPFSERMARAAKAREVRFLDAPVAGSKKQAEAAQLAFFVGGDKDDVSRAGPLFEAMGTKVVHASEHGAGTSLKMVVNHLLGTSMVGFAEGLVLGEALGLPQALLLDVLVGGPVAPPYLTGKREKLESEVYAPEFPLKWMHKDMHMVALAAYEGGVPVPLANLVKEGYQDAVRAGLGDLDFSCLYAHLRGKGDVSP